MKSEKEKQETLNSKGAAIFKVMLDDKKAVHEHLKNGGELEDILKELKQKHVTLSFK